jgi:hypothetical protein
VSGGRFVISQGGLLYANGFLQAFNRLGIVALAGCDFSPQHFHGDFQQVECFIDIPDGDRFQTRVGSDRL